MAHHRRAVAAAALLNIAIVLGEAGRGARARSLSLLMDSLHHVSDELALVCLYAAFLLPRAPGRRAQRTANLLNSTGLIGMSALLVVQVLHHLADPRPVSGLAPILGGLAASAGNWGVARLLRAPARSSATVRLAYVHNLGDVLVSLVPTAAGLLVIVTGRAAFDALLALGAAVWLMTTTVRALRLSREDLLWPEAMTCGHEPAILTPSAG